MYVTSISRLFSINYSIILKILNYQAKHTTTNSYVIQEPEYPASRITQLFVVVTRELITR